MKCLQFFNFLIFDYLLITKISLYLKQSLLEIAASDVEVGELPTNRADHQVLPEEQHEDVRPEPPQLPSVLHSPEGDTAVQQQQHRSANLAEELAQHEHHLRPLSDAQEDVEVVDSDRRRRLLASQRFEKSEPVKRREQQESNLRVNREALQRQHRRVQVDSTCSRIH